MVNKSAAPSCRSGYAKNEMEQIAKFCFPLENTELNKLWIRFVNHQNWKPTKHSDLTCANFVSMKNTSFEVKNVIWNGLWFRSRQIMQRNYCGFPSQCYQLNKPLEKYQRNNHRWYQISLIVFKSQILLKLWMIWTRQQRLLAFSSKGRLIMLYFTILCLMKRRSFQRFYSQSKLIRIYTFNFNPMEYEYPCHNGLFKDNKYEWLMSVCLKIFLHTLVILPLKTILNYLKK